MEFLIKLGLIGIGMMVVMYGITMVIGLIALIIEVIAHLFNRQDK